MRVDERPACPHCGEWADTGRHRPECREGSGAMTAPRERLERARREWDNDDIHSDEWAAEHGRWLLDTLEDALKVVEAAERWRRCRLGGKPDPDTKEQVDAALHSNDMLEAAVDAWNRRSEESR